MKLSMWMIAGMLGKYSPKYDIQDGDAHISGVRFFQREDMEFEWQYVYLGLNADVVSDSCPLEAAVLVNGRDRIIIQNKNVNIILNDLLAIFEYYNTWESSLWEDSSYKSFQRILDLSDCILGNPMMLFDADGNILAMSSTYKDEDINEYWIEARNTNHVPTVILSSPMHVAGGEITHSWTNEPTEYHMSDGTHIIGVFLTVDSENVAGFALWEHKKPINPGDVCLVRTLCTVLASMVGEKKRGVALRSISAIIEDLLSGMEIEEDLIRKLALKCTNPWQLVVIDNPFRSDIFHSRSIVNKLRVHAIPCVPLIYGDKAVVLVSGVNALPLVDFILGAREKQYYIVGLSLPFDELRMINVRYEQTLFSLDRVLGKPGIYYAEDYAFLYLLSLAGEKNKRQGLTHPGLTKLRRYDKDKQTELYDTLFFYLLNERSILLGSKAMHVHRNSFMYRIQRIKSITGLELDDPMTRAYLLFSYFLEKAEYDLSYSSEEGN